MSKSFNRQIDASAILVLLLSIFFFNLHISNAQQVKRADRKRSSSVVRCPKCEEVAAATSSALKETSDLRQLKVLRPVKSGAKSRSEIESLILRRLDIDSSPEELRVMGLMLSKLGLVPKDFQVRSFLVKLLTEQIAGYYDPQTREFNLADWLEASQQKPIMVHELTHALQDQHFNLKRFMKWPKGDADAELAAQALFEGDATLAMQLYLVRNPREGIAMLTSSLVGSNNNEQINNAPRVLRETLLFPYTEGSSWAQKVYRKGGWDLISKAYRELPQSTEQILHVEKYFAREAPIKISLPDLSTLLGSGWKRVDYDTNGEWGYYLILDELLADYNSSKAAAAGWAGDRYALYEQRKSGKLCLVNVSQWDTEADAIEFFDAYTKRVPLRYKEAKPISESVTSAPALLQKIWRTSEDMVVVERRGLKVVVVEGVPEPLRAELLKSIQ
jgi:hypothetical protein